MRSKGTMRELQSCIIEAVIEVPGQPVALTTKELISVPSQYMKCTEMLRKFYIVKWDNSRLSREEVYKLHLKALKRKHKLVQARMLDLDHLLTSSNASKS